MDSKWFLIVICSLALNLTYGSSDVGDSVAPNTTDAKQWRNIKLSITTTTTRKVGTTTRKSLSTTKKGPTTSPTKRAGQLIVAPTVRASTTSKRPGQSPAGRTSTTMRRTTQFPLRGFSGPSAKTTTTTKQPLRTMPPLPTMKGYTTAPAIRVRGVPEKIKEGSTTRRGATTTTKRTIRTTIPVLLKMRPGIALLSSPFSFFGQPMYSPPIAYGLPAETTTASANLTTTVDPAGSTTVETSTISTTTSTATTADNSTTASNDTVEYEDTQQVIPTAPEYDYPEEGDSTTSASTTVPAATEPALNGTSTMGPNMIRKRRKKVITTSATTPSTSLEVVRIRVRRKKTTIAPVTEAVPEDGA